MRWGLLIFASISQIEKKNQFVIFNINGAEIVYQKKDLNSLCQRKKDLSLSISSGKHDQCVTFHCNGFKNVTCRAQLILVNAIYVLSHFPLKSFTVSYAVILFIVVSYECMLGENTGFPILMTSILRKLEQPRFQIKWWRWTLPVLIYDICNMHIYLDRQTSLLAIGLLLIAFSGTLPQKSIWQLP